MMMDIISIWHGEYKYLFWLFFHSFFIKQKPDFNELSMQIDGGLKTKIDG